jgi:hypothetical protein
MTPIIEAARSASIDDAVFDVGRFQRCRGSQLTEAIEENKNNCYPVLFGSAHFCSVVDIVFLVIHSVAAVAVFNTIQLESVMG